MRSRIPALAATLLAVMALRAANPPMVSGVSSAAGYQSEFSSGSWFSVYGSDFATAKRVWTGNDFEGTKLPLSLDGVSVKVNGKAAPMCFLSPTQINALAPEDMAIGPVTIEVITPSGSSSITASKAAMSPGLFLNLPTRIAIVQAVDGTNLGPPEVSAIQFRRAARPGEAVILWGSGFGPSDPAVSPLVISPAAALAQVPTVTIGSANATVLYAGITAPGLVQMNIVIPEGLNGNYEITARIGGVQTPAGMLVAVRP